MNNISSTPSLRDRRRRVAGVSVTLSWPKSDAPVNGVTFLLPGAMISISEFNSVRDIIIEHNHLVVSTFMNVMWPLTNNHRKHAKDVKKIFDELKATFHDELRNISRYNLIGHSVGAKVSLLVASIIDSKRVKAVLALDPVDIGPTEFTKSRGSNLPLGDEVTQSDGEDGVIHVQKTSSDIQTTGKDKSGIDEAHQSIPIILTCTDGGLGIPESHNACAIHKFHPATTKCYRHKHAGHLAYYDNGGGKLAKMLMPDIGTKQGNQKARDAAYDLVRQLLRSE